MLRRILAHLASRPAGVLPYVDINMLGSDAQLLAAGYAVTRSSSARNHLGIDFANNTAVFEAGKGILIEGGRTNVSRQSIVLSDSFYSTKTGVTVTDDQTAGPDGTTTAEKIVENSAATTCTFGRGSAPASPPANDFVISIYVKYGGRQWMELRSTDSAAVTKRTWFDLQNGVKGTSQHDAAGIINVSNGWYRIWIYHHTTTAAATLATYALQSRSADNSTGAISAGDGSIYTYAWGMQAEAGFFPSGMIVTLNASAGRGTPGIGLTLNNITDAHTTLIKARMALGVATGVDQVLCQLDNDNVNSIVRLFRNSSRELRLQILTTGTERANLLLGTAFDDTVISAGFTTRPGGSLSVFMVGGTVQTTTPASLPVMNRSRIGHGGNTAAPASHSFAWIQRFARWPGMTDTELQAAVTAL